MALTESDKKLQTGDAAPDFNLPGIDGKMHNLGDIVGQEGTLIIFMCNHCPYVHAKIDAMAALHKKFGGKVGIIGINSNDPEYPGEGMDNMKEFVSLREMSRRDTKGKRIEFLYLLDADQQVARAYGATCTPDPFLFDGEGKLVFHGKLNDAMQPDDTPTEQTMEHNIGKLLSGEAIDPWFDPSMGCSIKFTQ